MHYFIEWLLIANITTLADRKIQKESQISERAIFLDRRHIQTDYGTIESSQLGLCKDISKLYYHGPVARAGPPGRVLVKLGDISEWLLIAFDHYGQSVRICYRRRESYENVELAVLHA